MGTRLPNGRDAEGAVPVDEELLCRGRGPQIRARCDHDVGPAGVRLRPMMAPAQRRQVAATGRAAVLKGNDVIHIRTAGPAGAGGEHALGVPGHHLLAEPRRDLVAVCGLVPGQVDHRAHGHPRARGTAPGADLLGQDGRARVLTATHTAGAHSGGAHACGAHSANVRVSGAHTASVRAAGARTAGTDIAGIPTADTGPEAERSSVQMHDELDVPAGPCRRATGTATGPLRSLRSAPLPGR